MLCFTRHVCRSREVAICIPALARTAQCRPSPSCRDAAAAPPVVHGASASIAVTMIGGTEVASSALSSSLSSPSDGAPLPPDHLHSGGYKRGLDDAAAGSSTSTEAEGNDETAFDADGWSTSAALQAIFPPTPTITGFRAGHVFRPTRFRCWSPNVLVVPQQRPACPDGAYATTIRDDAAFLRRNEMANADNQNVWPPLEQMRRRPIERSSLLRDASSLPCRVGLRATPPLSLTTPQWVEQVERNFTNSPRPPQTFRSYSEISAFAEQSSPLPLTPQEWSSVLAYADMQTCIDASSAALRCFAMHELGQRAPLLLFLGERPYIAGDEGVRGRAICGKRGGGHRADMPSSERTDCDVSTEMLTRRVPVEAYVERTPLTRTSGTAALQLALQRAFLPAASWLTSDAANTEQDSADSSRAARMHVLWSGGDWVIEADRQLISMEERLLLQLRTEGLDKSRSPIRAWLPSRWNAAPKIAMMPSAQECFAESALFSRSESWASSCGSHRCHLSASSVQPRWMRMCTSWMFRLHRSWLVTGLNKQTCRHALIESREPEQSGGSSRESVVPVLNRTLQDVVQQPNYDLLTGMPLNVTRSGAGSHGSSAPADQRTQQQRLKSRNEMDSRATMMRSLRKGTPQLSETSAPSTHHKRKNDHAEANAACCLSHSERPWSPSSAAQWSESSPISSAYKSRRVGWVPVQQRPSLCQSKLEDAQQRWCLPPALHAFSLPNGADRVRSSWLTDHCSAYAPSSPAAKSLSSTPSPLCCGVTVPRREWYSGFFTHTAPTWWMSAVAAALRESKANYQKESAVEEMACGAGVDAAASQVEQNCAESILNVDLIRRLMDLGCIPRLPDGVLEAASTEQRAPDAVVGTEITSLEHRVNESVPTIYVLQLRAALPTVRRRGGAVIDEGKEENKHSRSRSRTQLFWSCCRSDAAAVTVNFVFTLNDVLRTRSSTSSTPQPAHCRASSALSSSSSTDGTARELKSRQRNVLLFVELKAGLEVLRCVTLSAKVSSTCSSTWWSLLENFYCTSTAELATASLSSPRHGSSDGTVGATLAKGSGDPRTEMRGARVANSGPAQAALSAYCHPTAFEVAQKLLCLLFEQQTLDQAPRRALYVPSLTDNLMEASTQHNRGDDVKEVAPTMYEAQPVPLTSWPRKAYHDLLHATHASTLSSSTARLEDSTEEFWDSIGEEEEGEIEDADETTQTQANEEVGRTADVSAAGDGTISVSVDPPTQLPFGVEVHEYDEDGTRIRHAEAALTRNIYPYLCDEGPTGSPEGSVAAFNKEDAWRPSTRTPSDAEWPAIDRRTFAQQDHRLEDAMRPPGRPPISARDGEALASHASSIQDGTSARRIPYMRFPSAPPVAVAALGIERALSVVAAYAEAKQHGYSSQRFSQHRHDGHVRRSRAFAEGTRSPLPNDAGLWENAAAIHSIGKVCEQQTESKAGCAKGETGASEGCNSVSIGHTSTCIKVEDGSVSVALVEVGNGSHRANSADTSTGEIYEIAQKPHLSSKEAVHLSSSETRTTSDLIASLIDNEEQHFARNWRPWLKFLPCKWVPHAEPDDSGNTDTSFFSLASDPRVTFPFLRPSRIAECHRSTAACPREAPSESQHQPTPRELPEHPTSLPLDEFVHANDLGLSVIDILHSDTYVNAYNLFYKEEATD